jgi:alkanesulfonate monooxygenase SsuD/methylene tetrahydromethanopterin reductase-like flavin-dependent oxidoreductase (luciferase family)
MNMAVLNAVQDSNYYGKDTEKDRESNIAKHGLEEKIELGELIVGSPETVVSQIKKIHDELGPGILDVISAVQLGDRTNKSLSLMGAKVMPQIKDW